MLHGFMGFNSRILGVSSRNVAAAGNAGAQRNVTATGNAGAQHCAAECPDALVGIDGIQRFAPPNPEKSRFVARISSSQRPVPQTFPKSVEYRLYGPFRRDIRNKIVEYRKYQPRTRLFLDWAGLIR